MMSFCYNQRVLDELVKKLEKNYGIIFQNWQVLETAFTHSSYQNELGLPKIANNERLEFLGDAALQAVISEYLYISYPEKLEGELSKMRSSIVRSESLAEFSQRCGFDKYLLLGHGEEQSGGRLRHTTLENLFEAFLGALLIDQGLEVVRTFLYQVVVPSVESGNFEPVIDYKTALQEALQINGDTHIEYRLESASGPAHHRHFVMGVYEYDKKLGQGQGASKKLAEQAAAEDAFRHARGGLD